MTDKAVQLLAHVCLAEHILQSCFTLPLVTVLFTGVVLVGGVDGEVPQQPGDGGWWVTMPGNAHHPLYPATCDC